MGIIFREYFIVWSLSTVLLLLLVLGWITRSLKSNQCNSLSEHATLSSKVIMVRKFKTLKQSLTNHKLETLTVQVYWMCELHEGLLLSVKLASASARFHSCSRGI